MSIAEVARTAGITSRTLRHYDEIGLLAPAFVASNGYRYYQREQLLRLQQILVLRELDLGLPAIGRILAGETDEVAALQTHRGWLLAQSKRLRRLALTVQRTIDELEGRGTMTATEMFDGFDPEQQQRYEAEVIEKWGEGARQAIEDHHARHGEWTSADYARVDAAYAEVEDGLVEQLRQGAAPEQDSVQRLIARHYGLVCEFWTPDAEQLRGLAATYTDDPRFRARYEAKDPQLPEFLRAGCEVYAGLRL